MKIQKTQTKPRVGHKTTEAGSRRANERPINLYWVTTHDHDEDWFIFARTRRAAAGFHERYEGYNAFDASARTILTNVHLGKYENGTPPCHAQTRDLQALGFEILARPIFERAVRFRGELFAEGCMEALVREAADNQLEAAGKGRPNGTTRSGRVGSQADP